MNKYTEAIQGDNVVILCDGIPMGVGEILAALNAATPPADAALADALALADAWQREFGELARAIGCLPSSFVGHNQHAIKAAAALRARQEVEVQCISQHDERALQSESPIDFARGWNNCVAAMLAASQQAAKRPELADCKWTPETTDACPYCAGEACRLCGPDPLVPCEHDCVDRHQREASQQAAKGDGT